MCGKDSPGEVSHDYKKKRLLHYTNSTRNIVYRSSVFHCGDIELAGYLANAAGPVPLVLDLCVAHDRVGSSVDPTLNGHLGYHNNLDQSLNDTATVKIRKYHTDYNNNPSRDVVFMPVIVSTSGRFKLLVY
jgi:hypothetical protein